MIKIKISAKHRGNLEKLAAYLQSLPKGYTHFEMRDFVCNSNSSDPELIRYMKENGGFLHCGTAACAVGHGPQAGVYATRTDFDYGNTINWYQYSRTKFASNDMAWEWMFGSAWGDVDNHHWGAAARIRYYLENEGLPDGWEEAYEDEGYSPFKRKYGEYRIRERVPVPVMLAA